VYGSKSLKGWAAVHAVRHGVALLLVQRGPGLDQAALEVGPHQLALARIRVQDFEGADQHRRLLEVQLEDGFMDDAPAAEPGLEPHG
jgi:hypothetical protein